MSRRQHRSRGEAGGEDFHQQREGCAFGIAEGKHRALQRGFGVGGGLASASSAHPSGIFLALLLRRENIAARDLRERKDRPRSAAHPAAGKQRRSGSCRRSRCGRPGRHRGGGVGKEHRDKPGFRQPFHRVPRHAAVMRARMAAVSRRQSTASRRARRLRRRRWQGRQSHAAHRRIRAGVTCSTLGTARHRPCRPWPARHSSARAKAVALEAIGLSRNQCPRDNRRIGRNGCGSVPAPRRPVLPPARGRGSCCSCLAIQMRENLFGDQARDADIRFNGHPAICGVRE